MKWVDESPAPDWPAWPAERPLPAEGRWPRVLITGEVHRRGLGPLGRQPGEGGGPLLGISYHPPPRPAEVALIEVLDAVPAPSTSGTMVSLRMDGEVWSAANRRLDALRERLPFVRIVGWYHSHPGFGAFFSDPDRRTQAAFFREAYGVGWCVDPSDDTHACFVGAASAAVAFEFVDNETNIA